MLRRHYILFSNILMILLILGGFTIIELNDIRYYHLVAQEEVENAVSLTALNVATEIESASSEQRAVALAMSNDLFLQQWLKNESSSSQDELVSYLKKYKNTYDYTVTFLVSDASRYYYYNEGLNKIIDPKDNFDSWYYNFVALDQPYDIQVDRDEVNNYDISLFVNCRVEDEDGKLLGVVGSAKNINSLQDDMKYYESTYDLNVYITNIGNAHNSFTGSTDNYRQLSELSKTLGIDEEIFRNAGKDGYITTAHNKCMIVRHIDSLNWDVVIVKDTYSLKYAFLKRLRSNFIYVILLIIIMLTFSLFGMNHINRRLVASENTDELTGLANRKLFEDLFAKLSGRYRRHEASFFILDIDNFKHFNDTLGHLYGNSVLQLVSSELKELVGDNGVAARWGGDEFVGYLKLSTEKAYNLLSQLNSRLEDKETQMDIHVSVGICNAHGKYNLEQLTYMADLALYHSKENGKAQCSIYTPEMDK